MNTKLIVGLGSFLFAMGALLADIPVGVRFTCLIVGGIVLFVYLVFGD